MYNNIWGHSKLNLFNEGEMILLHWVLLLPCIQHCLSDHCSQCSILWLTIHHRCPQDVKWRRTTLCFLDYDIQLGSSLVEKETHKAVDCLVQSHFRASNQCFLQGTVFHFSLLYVSPVLSLSVITYHSCFRRAFFSTSTFYWTYIVTLASKPLIPVFSFASRSVD